MSLERFIHRGWELLLETSLKSLLLLAVAGLTLLCLRRASAAMRHLVLLLTLVCLLLLPLLSSSLPGWPVGLWPRTAILSPPSAGPLDAPTPSSSVTTSNPGPASPPVAATDPPSLSTVPDQAAAAVQRPPHAPWFLLGFVLWIAGVCAVLTPVLFGLVGVHRLGRRSLPVASGVVAGLAAQLGQQIGIRRSLSLLRGTASDPFAVPMTWGWRRPVVLLPSDLEDWPAERLRVVLLHELSHIRRNDWLWQMLAHVACALYWFHPGVWFVARGLRIESERACDDQVLSAGVPASDYARHLVEVARSISQAGAAPKVVMPMATSQVKERITALMQTGKQRNTITKLSAIFTAFVVVSVLFPLAALRPRAQAQAALAPVSAAERAKANARVSAVHAVPGEADAYKLEAEGSHLTPDQAYELERNLAAAPDNLTLRIKALGYYSRSTRRFASANTLRDAQILWLIRTHPDNVLLGTPGTYIFPKTDGAAYTDAKRLWLSYADAPSPNIEILGNGASFLTLNDFPDAEQLYLKTEATEPKDPVWPNRLGNLYQLQEFDHHGGMTPDYRTWAQKALAQYQRVPGANPQDSHDVSLLAAMAKASYDAGDYHTARACAQRLLQLPDLDKDSVGMRFFNEGSVAVHEGNMILGRLVLRNGDTASAEAHLLAMGRVSGSSSLSSFGPNMQLAQDLLEQGDRAIVLQYFDECAKFWQNDDGQLAQWRTAVKCGQMPDFGGNLSY